MRIGDWLEAVDRKDPTAWGILLDSTRRLAREHGAREPEDLASSFVLAQFEHGARDARRANPAVPLDHWLGGCMRRQVRTEGSRTSFAPSTLGDAVGLIARDDSGAAPPADPTARRAELRRRMECRLSPSEIAAVELHLEGAGQRAAAERLGITRDSYRDRLERAIGKLTARTDPRAWAAQATDASAAEPPATSLRAVLAHYVGGMRLHEIAAATGLSYSCVRSRIARVRGKARRRAGGRRAVRPVAVPDAA